LLEFAFSFQFIELAKAFDYLRCLGEGLELIFCSFQGAGWYVEHISTTRKLEVCCQEVTLQRSEKKRMITFTYDTFQHVQG
jgi:hypothetical protein